MSKFNPSNFPMVTLDIERARHSIKIALADHMSKVNEDLERAIDHAVDTFDFQGLVSEIVSEELEKALRAALPSIFAAAFQLSGVQSIINESVKKSLQELDISKIIEEEL